MISKPLVLLSLLLAAAVSGGAAAVYNATDLFLFNCGSTSGTADQSGRKWSVEDRRLLAANPDNASFSATASVQDPSVAQVPYMTARLFRSDFTYSFPVSPGWKFVRFYFYPTRYDSDFDAVNSFFAVTVNGFSLMRNFSAHLTATGSVPSSKSLIKEFIIPVLDGQTLNLTFTPSPNSLAFVNGIEIVSMPDRFYTKGGFDDAITNVDNFVGFEISNTTAFETVYRVNVGGREVTAVGDTGMFRRWVPDDGYLVGNLGQTPYLDVQINYTAKTPAYVAPEEVYTTYRTMGFAHNPLINLNFNLTWYFTVDVGFRYLVRLHFCETMQEVTAKGQRIFSIFIGNQMVVPDADVIFWSGGSKIPVYKDFVKLVASNGGEKRRDLWLDLHPNKDVNPKFYDAILNGVEILKLSNSEGNLAGPNPETPPPPPPSPFPGAPTSQVKGLSNVLVISLAVSGSVVGLSIVMVVVVLLRRQRRKRQRKTVDYRTHATTKPKDSWDAVSYTTASTNTNSTSTLPSDLCRRFSIAEIRSATDDFNDKLIIGVGGFGNVYKGRVDNGSTIVAIKRLGTSSHQGIREFETELKMLSKLRHIHLVSLIGYCDEDNEMILVYEYMSRGTIRDHLYGKAKVTESPLPWNRRLEISIGAARGLQYLHTGAKHPIIHRDIKSTNILLDDNYVAKVSDFGLSKVGPTSVSQTHVTTVVKGSVGYLDPEYYRRQLLTDKSDVYSFGVVLFEVLCGRPVRISGLDAEQVDLIRWFKLNHSRGTVDQILDPYLTADITRVSLDKFCEIAVRCVHDRGTERPTMNDVVWALEFALQLHETAKKNGNSDGLVLINTGQSGYNSPLGEVGTTDDGDDLFSRTTRHMSESTSTKETSLLKYEETTGSSTDAVFSEIREPKGR